MTTMVWMFAIGFSIAIGYWSKNRGRGFWFGFLFSIILCPIIGVLIVLIAGKKEQDVRDS